MYKTIIIVLIGLVCLIALLIITLIITKETYASSCILKNKCECAATNVVYQGKEILDLMNLFTSADPTHGCVDYGYFSTITDNPLIIIDSKNHLILGVGDSEKTPLNSTLKDQTSIPSVRLYSKQIFNGGIFSFEIFHIPSGQGVWPAIWFSQDGNQILPDGKSGVWPNNGEIDLIEQVNDNVYNSTTLHIAGYTTKGLCPQECQGGGGPCHGCKCPDDCEEQCGSDACPWSCHPDIQPTESVMNDPYCSTFGNNAGCTVRAPDNTFGKAFNDKYSKAVFTLNWDRLSDNQFIITIYFITDAGFIDDNDKGPFSQNPDFTGLKPYGIFTSKDTSYCMLKDLQLIINITLCGDWAGSVITDCVENIKSSIKKAYWEIGRIAIKK